MACFSDGLIKVRQRLYGFLRVRMQVLKYSSVCTYKLGGGVPLHYTLPPPLKLGTDHTYLVPYLFLVFFSPDPYPHLVAEDPFRSVISFSLPSFLSHMYTYSLKDLCVSRWH